MKRFAVLVLLILVAPAVRAGVVLHDGREGIVSFSDDGVALDSEGRVWNLHDSEGWARWPSYDPPVPVAEIRFWTWRRLVTMDNELWIDSGSGWVSFGSWPASGLPESGSGGGPAAAVSPNPAAGPCRVSFTLKQAGPVSVRVVDVTGRQVRALLEAELPAGACTITWDGRDGTGQPAPAGVYFARVEIAGGTQAVRVILTD